MSSDDALDLPLPRPDYSAEEDAWRMGGGPPLVAAGQPAPADMPPLPLMVLDALADDSENIYSMRNCGDMAADGLALVGDAHVLDALRSLLADGLIEVDYEHVVVAGRVGTRPLVGEPRTTDDDLRRYWFHMTPTGRTTWDAAADVLEAYGDAHSLEPHTRRDNAAPT